MGLPEAPIAPLHSVKACAQQPSMPKLIGLGHQIIEDRLLLMIIRIVFLQAVHLANSIGMNDDAMQHNSYALSSSPSF